MVCNKCGAKMTVLDTVTNKQDFETYRRLKCSECGNSIYTCECIIEYESIKKDFYKHHRSKK